jgi:hypothetical protein
MSKIHLFMAEIWEVDDFLKIDNWNKYNKEEMWTMCDFLHLNSRRIKFSELYWRIWTVGDELLILNCQSCIVWSYIV